MNATLKLGEHFIFDLSDCNPEILMDSERAYSLFAQAVYESGLTVVDEGFYKFSPPGFTVDEPVDALGEKLALPEWFESNRSAIEQGLPPITLGTIEKVN